MRRREQLTSHTDDRIIPRLTRKAVVGFAAVLPFAIWPGIERPFSAPKIILLAAFVLVTASCAIAGRFSFPKLPLPCWISLAIWCLTLAVSGLQGEFTSQTAFWLPLLSVAGFLLVLAVQPRAEALTEALSVSLTLTALLALFQYLGLDFFQHFGWTSPHFESPRMRVYATLGNPNFVAAFLAGGLPLTLVIGHWRRPRWLLLVVIILQAAALFATGSRAAIIGTGAAVIWFAIVGKLGYWRILAIAGLVLLATLPLMPSRPLKTTLEGRLYIWRITAPHLSERPLFGFGPGGFEPKFAQWETSYWREGRAADNLRQFIGVQTHAHNDYLETAVDHGFAGLVSLLALLTSFLAMAFPQSRRPKGELDSAASAGIVALASIALVDFPFHRPTEMFLFWTLLALVCLKANR